jgi:hypothetical protein
MAMGVPTHLSCEHVNVNGELVSGELNFCEQHKIFKEYSCHISQIFSMYIKIFHSCGHNIILTWQEYSISHTE